MTLKKKEKMNYVLDVLVNFSKNKNNLMKKRITLILIIVCIILVGFVSVKNVSDVPSEYRVDSTSVKATIYKPSCGVITADGFKINKKHSGEHRLIAVSRDLISKFPFGTRVLVMGTGALDGIYVVKDLMAKRWKNKIDILVDQKSALASFKNVTIYKISDDYKISFKENI